MGSAEQEIILPLVAADEMSSSTTVSLDVFDEMEDKKNIENEGACVVSELPIDYVKSSQTLTVNVKLAVNCDNIIDEINESIGSTSSTNQKSDGSSCPTLLDARYVSDNIELQQRADVQYVTNKVIEICEYNAVGSFHDNTYLGNCDASVSKFSSAETNMQRNEEQSVISGLNNDTAEESGLVGKSNIQTTAVQEYDQLTLASYEQGSAVPRVHGSDRHLQTAGDSRSTYWTAVVPQSNDQQYSFRYGSSTLTLCVAVFTRVIK